MISEEPISDGGAGPLNPLGDTGSTVVSSRKEVQQKWPDEAYPVVTKERPAP